MMKIESNYQFFDFKILVMFNRNHIKLDAANQEARDRFLNRIGEG